MKLGFLSVLFCRKKAYNMKIGGAMMEPDSKNCITKNVRILRKAAKYTQAELAERCGLSSDLISKVERGQTNITQETLSKLATGLGVPLVMLFDENLDTEKIKGNQDLELYFSRLLILPTIKQREIMALLDIFLGVDKNFRP
ncbi:MAG: helix-turn-helix transcriptional regulator [Anaerotruncus sp.]|nr:helix-turn-helix transcriptional regulator [Anaerotruncus sp.]